MILRKGLQYKRYNHYKRYNYKNDHKVERKKEELQKVEQTKGRTYKR